VGAGCVTAQAAARGGSAGRSCVGSAASSTSQGLSAGDGLSTHGTSSISPKVRSSASSPCGRWSCGNRCWSWDPHRRRCAGRIRSRGCGPSSVSSVESCVRNVCSACVLSRSACACEPSLWAAVATDAGVPEAAVGRASALTSAGLASGFGASSLLSARTTLRGTPRAVVMVCARASCAARGVS